jgi:hypothetical protein
VHSCTEVVGQLIVDLCQAQETAIARYLQQTLCAHTWSNSFAERRAMLVLLSRLQSSRQGREAALGSTSTPRLWRKRCCPLAESQSRRSRVPWVSVVPLLSTT